MKAETCQICLMLRKSGFFNNIDKELLDKVNIIYIDQETMKLDPTLPAIFTKDPGFPNFKFMSNATFEKASNSGNDWEQFIDKVCIYNGQFSDKGELIRTKEYTNWTVDNIANFCQVSHDSLAKVGKRNGCGLYARYPPK